jgi:hypothetical protein
MPLGRPFRYRQSIKILGIILAQKNGRSRAHGALYLTTSLPDIPSEAEKGVPFLRMLGLKTDALPEYGQWAIHE